MMDWLRRLIDDVESLKAASERESVDSTRLECERLATDECGHCGGMRARHDDEIGSLDHPCPEFLEPDTMGTVIR